jgi:hypothetical protein
MAKKNKFYVYGSYGDEFNSDDEFLGEYESLVAAKKYVDDQAILNFDYFTYYILENKASGTKVTDVEWQ